VLFEQHEALVGRPDEVAAYSGMDLEADQASLALLRGAQPKVISEALGHASVAFTMDTYSHIMSGMQEGMMALLDGVIPSGVTRYAQLEGAKEVA